jgi:hypothetical protein
MYNDNKLRIKVNKSDLLNTLKESRKSHAAEYSKAKTGFKKLLEKELEKKLADLRSGKKVELTFQNRKPDSHINDYDEVIEMLELSTDVEIELSHQQWKQYIKNEWDWLKTWSLSNANYLSAAK